MTVVAGYEAMAILTPAEGQRHATPEEMQRPWRHGQPGARHEGFHQTDTADYAVVLKREV